MLEVRQLKRAAAAAVEENVGRAGKGRGRGRGRARAAVRRVTLAAKKKLSKEIVWKKWPILRPLSLAASILEGGQGRLLCHV